jgi:hypothetical protein
MAVTVVLKRTVTAKLLCSLKIKCNKKIIPILARVTGAGTPLRRLVREREVKRQQKRKPV